MMKILKHFDMEDSEHLTYKLKNDEVETFLSKLPKAFRGCYVSKKKIDKTIEKGEISKEEFISSFLPDVGNIKSGDFGEILSYFLMKEKNLPLILFGPKKWLWKVDRNKPMPYTDVVLFYNKKASPTKDDFILSCEVKTKATPNKSTDPIQSAIDDSMKDSVSRLSKTLVWMRDRYIQKGKSEKIKKLDRFINSVELIEYKKKFRAIVVIDEKLVESELEKGFKLPEIEDEIELLIVSVENLQGIYEETFNEIPRSFE